MTSKQPKGYTFFTKAAHPVIRDRVEFDSTMDITQTILLSVIIVLSTFLVVLGIQVFFVLKALKVTIKKMNALFEDASGLVEEIKKPVAKAQGVITALATGASIVNLLKKGRDNERSKQG